jgi:hypothetical protein
MIIVMGERYEEGQVPLLRPRLWQDIMGQDTTLE